MTTTTIRNNIHYSLSTIDDIIILEDIYRYTKLKGLVGLKLFEQYLSKYMIPESAKNITYKSFIGGLDLINIENILNNMEDLPMIEFKKYIWKETLDEFPQDFINICINDKQSSNNVTTGKGESALCLFYKGKQNSGAEKGDIKIHNKDIEVKGKAWLIGKSGNTPDVPKDIIISINKIVNNIIKNVYPNLDIDIPAPKVKALPKNLYHYKNILNSSLHISESVIETCLLSIMNHIDNNNENNERVIKYVMSSKGTTIDYKYVTNLYQYKYLKEYSHEFDYMVLVSPESYQFISSTSIQDQNVFFDVTTNSTDSSSRGGGYQGRYGDHIINYSYT